MILKHAINHGYRIISAVHDKAFSFFDFKTTRMVRACEAWIREVAGTIPRSNGSGYYRKSSVRIGIITDEYMFDYYEAGAELFYLTPANYRDVIERQKLDLVLYVTCWYGLGSAREYRNFELPATEAGKRLGCANLHSENVAIILEYARKYGVPAIFQSIEDPSSYHHFLDIAFHADYIFTSDESMIGQYKSDTGNDNVYYLAYGINPKIQNPIGIMMKWQQPSGLRKVFFSGSWYEGFLQRCIDMRMLFDGVIQADALLIVADRNLHEPKDKRATLTYPDKYKKFIISPIEHSLLQDVHKLFDYSINLNSITNSPTMCAMRIYELQALGNLVISNYALSVSRTFPGIFAPLDSSEVSEIIQGYDARTVLNFEMDGIRNVLSDKTVFDRLNFIFETIGMQPIYPERRIIAIVDDGVSLDGMAAFQEGITIEYVHASDAYTLSDLDDSYLIKLTDTGNPWFIQDLVNAHKYTDVDFTAYVPESRIRDAYGYTQETGINENSLYDLSKVNFDDVMQNRSSLRLNGFRIGEPSWGHLGELNSYQLGVIIPVHNNGMFLRDRCLRSLMRSTIFKHMHIYLIDNGSTDPMTTKILNYLDNSFQNITLRCSTEGGEPGSPALRNYEFDNVLEPYITFLSPDNEAVNDGYSKLLKIVTDSQTDIAFGTVLAVPPDNRYSGDLRYPEIGLIDGPYDAINRNDFAAQSIQSCIIRSKLLKGRRMECVEETIGNDILFYMLMVSAKSVYSADFPVHVRYEDQDDSEANSVSTEYFKESYILEDIQAKFLRGAGLLEAYKEKRLTSSMDGRYWKKLQLVCDRDREICHQIISEIEQLYN